MSVYARQSNWWISRRWATVSAASTLLFLTVALCTVLYISFSRVRFDTN